MYNNDELYQSKFFKDMFILVKINSVGITCDCKIRTTMLLDSYSFVRVHYHYAKIMLAETQVTGDLLIDFHWDCGGKPP